MTQRAARRKLVELINSPDNTVRVASRRAGERVRATAARQGVFEVERAPDGVCWQVRYTGRDA